MPKTIEQLQLENNDLKVLAADLCQLFDKLEMFLAYIQLVQLIRDRDVVVKKKKNTEISRNFIDVIYSDYLELLALVMPDEAKRKEFSKFIKVFDLIEFKRTNNLVILTIGDKQVKGCSIPVDKYKMALHMADSL